MKDETDIKKANERIEELKVGNRVLLILLASVFLVAVAMLYLDGKDQEKANENLKEGMIGLANHVCTELDDTTINAGLFKTGRFWVQCGTQTIIVE